MEILKQNKYLYPIILVVLLSMGHNGYMVIEFITGKKIEAPKTYYQGKMECLDSLKSFQGELKAYKGILSKIESGILQFPYSAEENLTKENNPVWRN